MGAGTLSNIPIRAYTTFLVLGGRGGAKMEHVHTMFLTGHTHFLLDHTQEDKNRGGGVYTICVLDNWIDHKLKPSFVCIVANNI